MKKDDYLAEDLRTVTSLFESPTSPNYHFLTVRDPLIHVE
jgi:hypothetical protein